MSTKKTDIEASLGYAIGTAGALLDKRVEADLAGEGITLRQVQVLACLLLAGDLAQGEVAEMLRVEPSTIVRLVDRMEQEKWLERHADPNDRRRKLLRPTRKVNQHWNRLCEVGAASEARATRGISKKRLDELRKTLGEITSNLSDPS